MPGSTKADGGDRRSARCAAPASVDAVTSRPPCQDPSGVGEPQSWVGRVAGRRALVAAAAVGPRRDARRIWLEQDLSNARLDNRLVQRRKVVVPIAVDNGMKVGQTTPAVVVRS